MKLLSMKQCTLICGFGVKRGGEGGVFMLHLYQVNSFLQGYSVNLRLAFKNCKSSTRVGMGIKIHNQCKAAKT